MRRRPICIAYLLLMCVLMISDWLGMPFVRDSSLPEKVRAYMGGHVQATVYGVVEKTADTSNSKSVYLKQTYLKQTYLKQSKPGQTNSDQSNQSYQSNQLYQSKPADQPGNIFLNKIRVFLEENEEAPVGASVCITGILEEIPEARNPGEFDSRQYYACRHVRCFLKKGRVVQTRSPRFSAARMLEGIQNRLQNALKRTAGEDAPVFSAMLLGEKSELDAGLRILYQMAGIIHILAISGLHISLIGNCLYALLKHLGLGLCPAGLISLAGIVFYGLLTGGSAPTVRAVCMFGISVGGKILGRIYDLLTALAVAGILLLAETPAYLYSSSFLLSFAAVLGTGLFLPALERLWEADEKGQKWKKTFLAAAAVQLSTLPVLLWFYGEISLAGIWLNLLVLPTAGVVLASGFAAMALGLFCPAAGATAALPGRLLLHLYEWLCRLAAKMPFCTWIGGRPKELQAGLYILCLLWILAAAELAKRGKNRFRLRLGVCASVAAGLVLLLYRPDVPGVWAACLDVGQGDCAVVEISGGVCCVIDGGSSSKTGTGRRQLLPYLKYRGIAKIDSIFISHTDEDHISAVRELLEDIRDGLTAIRAENLVLPAWDDPPQAWMELKNLAAEAGLYVREVRQGDLVEAGRARIQVLAPLDGAGGADPNEDGMVLMLEYGDFRGIFTGDIGEETEKRLLDCLEDVDFLKTAHHGSRYSTGEAFLEKTRPELAVISCSSTNRYGHPAPETVERLKEAGCQVAYTMKNGAITVETDGKKMTASGFLP